MQRNNTLPRVYILVMGVTGAGKSTFIKKATGLEGIYVGEGMDSGTTDPEEWYTEYEGYAVYFIDTPGFDDGERSDIEILSNIADYVNGIHAKREKLAGVLYMHDISMGRMRGSGVQNLQMLPELIGQDNLEFCTLVTTHWHTLADPTKELQNEVQLRDSPKYWQPILAGDRPAIMKRFSNTPESAWDIVKPHLDHRFTPAITTETAINGESYNNSSAGQAVLARVDNKILGEIENERNRRVQDRERIERLEREQRQAEYSLRQRFEAERSFEYAQKLRVVSEKKQKNRFVRWGLQIGAAAAAVGAPVVGGPLGLAAVAATWVPAAEIWAQLNSKKDEKKKDAIYDRYRKDGAAEWEKYKRSITEIERRSRFNKPTEQLNSANTGETKRYLSTNENDSGLEDDSDIILHKEIVEVSSLGEIETSIPSSQASKDVSPAGAALNRVQPQLDAEVPLQSDSNELSMLKEESREGNSTTLPHSELPKNSFWAQVYEMLSNWLTRIERPKAGLRRIQYTCGCGEPMFVDVNVLRPEGLERFQKQLAVSLAGPQRHILAESGAMPAGFPMPPQRAHVTGGSNNGGSNLPPVPHQTGPRKSPGDIQTESAQQQNFQADDVDARYLLLCVNTRNLTKLVHVDLTYTKNDQLLFDGIRRRYWDARRHDSWHFGLLTPQWLANRMPAAWRDWLGTVHLRVPRSAELIEFRLVPFHANICPDKVRLGLPPEYQVKVEKNYHYEPCPADIEVLSIPKFSHLLKPGIHSYDFWLTTLPKKLDVELPYQPAAVGWGLIIDEGWDWVLLLSNMLMLTILVGIAVVLYAILTHDPASAFGFGTYAIAIVTLLFTMKYWAWQEHEVS